MRKHFLLLMLLSLLPMVGWAQTATLGQVAIGEFTYGDAALPVPVVKDSEGAILAEGTHYEVEADAFAEEACTTPVEKQDMQGGTTYWRKITGKGAYLGQSKAVYFTAKKKVLTITVNTAFNRAYLGTVEPVIAVPGDLAYAGLATAAPYSDNEADIAGTTDITGTLTYTYAGYGKPSYNGGEYPIAFSGLTSNQYDIQYTAKNFTITGTPVVVGDLAVKAGTAFADQTYKGTAFVPADLTGLVLTYQGAELVQGTDFDIAKGTKDGWTTVAGGPYDYTVNFKGNYSGTAPDFGQFNIVAAPLSVDIANFNIYYDAAEHNDNAGLGKTTPADFKWYGFAAADVAGKDALIAGFTAPTIAINNKDAKAKNAGTYDLKLSAAATPVGSNYTVVNYLNTGKLTIDPLEITVKADNKTKGPGEADPAWTFTTTPALPGGDAIVAGSITFTRPEGNVVGQSYELTPDFSKVQVKNGGTDVTANYTWKAGTPKGTLTVQKGMLTITILDQDKFYGDDDPATIAAPEEDNYIVSGLVEGDEITSLTLVKSWTDDSDAGNFILDGTAEYTGKDHYTGVTIVPGIFTIKKAPLTVTLPIQWVDAVAPATAETQLTKEGIVIDGFKKGETVANQYNLTLKAGLPETAGQLNDQTALDGYILTLEAAAWKNYAINGAQTIAGKLIVGTGDATPLALDANADQFAAITAANGETKTVNITLRRNQTIGGKERAWKKAIWNCMVLPFDVTVPEISIAFGYAIVNVVDPANTTEGNVKFKLEMLNTIPANTPFFLKTFDDVADDYVATFLLKEIKAPETAYPSVKASSDEIGYKFVGAYDTKTITGNNEEHLRFRLGNVDAWNNIGNGSAATWDIVPFNAYMDLGATAGAREVVFTFEELDGSTTSIRSIDLEKADSAAGTNADGWYNLNGVKMQGAPTQKGIYIKDGKKVVLK